MTDTAYDSDPLRDAIAPGEPRILAIEGNRADGALDHVQIHLDPTIIEEQRQAGLEGGLQRMDTQQPTGRQPPCSGVP